MSEFTPRHLTGAPFLSSFASDASVDFQSVSRLPMQYTVVLAPELKCHAETKLELEAIQP